MNSWKKVAGLLGAAALTVALAGPALAEVKWAVPFDHYASTPGDGSNDTAFWEAELGLEEGDCEKIEGAALDAVQNEDGSASLGVAYDWVIVKQASSATVEFDNTIFMDVAADETVFADTNGDGVYDDGDSQGISHIIVCGLSETTTTTTTTTTEQTETTTTTTTTTFTQDTAADTDAPSEPNTATIGTSGPATPADSTWMLVIALGVLLGSIVVLTPAKARNRR
jgi:hypothetical protein